MIMKRSVSECDVRVCVGQQQIPATGVLGQNLRLSNVVDDDVVDDSFQKK